MTIDKRSVIHPVQPGRDFWSLLELKRYRCFSTLFIQICHIPESLCSQSTSSMAAPTPSTTPPALAAQRDGPVVFLSYGREDRDFVLRVAEALRLNGLEAPAKYREFNLIQLHHQKRLRTTSVGDA